MTIVGYRSLPDKVRTIEDISNTEDNSSSLDFGIRIA
jgi:hypothetical protein